MGVQLQDIGVQMRKVMIFSTRACYKIVCNHPILVGLLCFLALLYRSFPFVFSVLLSLSPVLVCTAVLLGTLLSFGQPNIPEIEREEKTVHDIVVPLKTGVLQDATVVEKDDESYSVDRYRTKETDTVDQLIEELGLGVNKLCEVERGDSFGDDAPLLENKSREIDFESRMFLEGGRELYDLGSEQKNEKNEERLDDGEILDHQYSPLPNVDDENLEFDNEKSVDPNVDDENLEFDNEKSVDSFDSRTVNIGSPVIDREILDRQYSPIPNMDDENLEFDNDKSVDSFDSKMVNVDSPPGSPLKQEEEEEEDEEEEDDEESLDSGSDRAESSSPDASMADIIPMLDELHPLLDEDTPQPINLSHDGFDAASEHSKSCDSDQESDDGTENQEVEAADDEKEDGKETTKDKQEQAKSAITWTEEDQKNLMDLGSSELERNQRLESLIARRRARKSMRTMVERNLIDLESVDLPFSIAPISTARNNPFDLPGDQYDLGLPPIPGSAPSILQPRRNPFDLPYDSSEEKPDLKEDSFQQEFKTCHAKESFFRRHESFNVRPSLFGPSRHEKKDILFRPYFVPEEMDSEGSSYSRFQRQSSELSDSRVSSIPETESVVSAIDLEDKNLIKEDTEDKNLSDEDLVDKDLIYKHSSEDQALLSGEEHTSRHVGHGSQSSDVDSPQMGAADWKDTGVGEVEMKWNSEENHHRVEPSLVQEGYVAKALDLTVTEIHSKSETLERHSSHSSSSSLSEEGEKIFDESETHWLSGLGERRDHSESVISREASLGGADFDIRGTSVDENQYWEPVYDLSPTPLKEVSSSSVATDMHVESDMGLSPVLVDRTLSPSDMEAVESGQEIEKSTRISEEMLASSPNSQPAEEDELLSEAAMLLKNNEVSNLESSENCEVSFSGDPVVTEGVVREDSLDSKASVSTCADQNILDQQGRVEHVLDRSLYSNFDTDIYLDAQHAEDQTMGSVFESTEAQSIDLFENEEHSSTPGQVSLVQPCTTFENPPLGNNLIDMEVAGIHLEHNGVHLSNLDAHTDNDPLSESYEGPISPQYQCSSTEKSFSQSDKELPSLDCKDHTEVQEPPLIVMESVEEASSTGQLNVYCEAEPITATPSSPTFASIPHGVDEVTADAGQSDIQENILDDVQNDNHIDASKSHQFFMEAIEFHENVEYIVEETDGIKEIDEGILSELDAVGDFSINDSISSLNEFDSGIDSSGVSVPVLHNPGSVAPLFLAEDSIYVHEKIFGEQSENLNASMAEQVYKIGEKIECGSEFFTPGISLKEDVDSSSTEFAGREFQESGDHKSAEEESLLTGNDWEPHGVNLNSNTEETNPGMPLVEAQSLKDLESIYEQTKLESMETEVAFGLSQSPQEVQLLQNSNTEDISPGLPLVEASSVKDLEAIYEQAKLSSMETKVVLGPSELNQSSNTEDADPGMPLVEASLLSDLESIYEQAKSNSMETEVVPGLSELNQSSNTEDADPGMPLVEASSLRDLESIYEQAKLNSMETEVVPGLSELPQEVQLEADTDSGMPLVVARSIEDLDSAFRQIDSKGSEKHDLLDPSHTDSGMSIPDGSAFDQIDSKGNEKHDSLHPAHADKASGESENSKNVTLQEHSSLVDNEIKFEARSTEDTDSDHLQLHESDAERHILRDSLVGDADALESLHVGGPSHEREMETDSTLKQETEDTAEKPVNSSLSSQDVLVEATHNVEGDSSKGTSSVKDCDVPEDGNGGTKKLNFEVDKSEDSNLATSAEKGDQETPEGDSSAMDVKAKKEESPGDSHKEE